MRRVEEKKKTQVDKELRASWVNWNDLENNFFKFIYYLTKNKFQLIECGNLLLLFVLYSCKLIHSLTTDKTKYAMSPGLFITYLHFQVSELVCCVILAN